MRLAREAAPYAVGFAIASVAAALLVSPLAAVPLVLLLAFTLWFFRDPERRPPDDPRLLVSPADGRVIVAGAGRLSIFMNAFNVHVCRAPAAGEVVSVDRARGGFRAAFRDAASEHNERVKIVVDGAGRVVFTLVAGLLARRIVCRVVAGDRVSQGQRIGLIQFGSRVDVHVPDGASLLVRVGDRVTAGETPVARLA
jgi:phosphatidylserine decarboxylase